MLFSQTALLWFEVLPDMSLALPGLSPALLGAPRLVVGAPRLVAGAPSYSEGRQECPPRVWYSPAIDASKFTLHILSDTPGGFQWLKYILLMNGSRKPPASCLQPSAKRPNWHRAKSRANSVSPLSWSHTLMDVEELDGQWYIWWQACWCPQFRSGNRIATNAHV